ncbi:MAG: preprotein translocase subunit SecY, partial [Candidatus Omnitrophica bacterium]|nr:preprotein translocase subunit SecY [Candidatus Omnitrophota bacterium]
MKIVSIYKDIKSIPDLKQRIIYTLMLLAVFRFGSFVILPGVDSSTLMALFNMSQGEGILGLLNTFVGGAFARGSIFSLGIMPYISASIIMQLMATALPSLRKLQEQENGQRKINQYTRLATIGITLFQSIAAAINLQTQYPSAIYISGFTFILTTVFCMVAGTMFLVWLGERITDNGIGNGVSLIIAVGIISELPIAMLNEIKSSPIMLFYAELIALGIVTMGVILLTQGTRNIPINYAKRMVGGGKVAGGMMNTIKSSIPLKVNSAGVMPIIFAQAIMFIPAQISLFFQDSDFWIATGSSLNNPNSIIYNLIFIFLIIVFTYFYNTIVIDSNKIAENLKT